MATARRPYVVSTYNAPTTCATYDARNRSRPGVACGPRTYTVRVTRVAGTPSLPLPLPPYVLQKNVAAVASPKTVRTKNTHGGMWPTLYTRNILALLITSSRCTLHNRRSSPSSICGCYICKFPRAGVRARRLRCESCRVAHEINASWDRVRGLTASFVWAWAECMASMTSAPWYVSWPIIIIVQIYASGIHLHFGERQNYTFHAPWSHYDS